MRAEAILKYASALLAWAALFLGLAHAQDVDLDRQIEQVRAELSTDPAGTGPALLAGLERRIESASPRQRVEIELIRIRHFALTEDMREGAERAIALSRQVMDVDQKISALRLSANLSIESGDDQSAFTLLGEALSLLDQTDSITDKVSVFGLASVFHSRSGDTNLAVDYATRAVDSARSGDNPRIKCGALVFLAHAYRFQGQVELAEEQVAEAMPHCQRSGDQIIIAGFRTLIGQLALARGQLEQARRQAEQVGELSQGIYSNGEIDSVLLLARIELLSGNHQLARDHYRWLIDRIADSERLERLAEALDGAAEASERLGDLAEATRLYQRFIETRQRHLSRARSMRTAQLTVQFDHQRRAQDIVLLREQQRAAELAEQNRSRQQRLRTFVLICGGVIVLLLLIWLLRALRERRHFRRLSDKDGLTGLFNHTRFFKQLDQELAHHHENGLALILADIDHFKRVNDRFGHQIGDEVLRHTARVIKEIFGTDQLIGRIGGEEFAVRLNHSEESEVIEKIQALRERLAGRARRRTDPPVTLSFGFGMAKENEGLESFRQRVDDALYRAKKQGRNRAIRATA